MQPRAEETVSQPVSLLRASTQFSTSPGGLLALHHAQKPARVGNPAIRPGINSTPPLLHPHYAQNRRVMGAPAARLILMLSGDNVPPPDRTSSRETVSEALGSANHELAGLKSVCENSTRVIAVGEGDPSLPQLQPAGANQLSPERKLWLKWENQLSPFGDGTVLT